MSVIEIILIVIGLIFFVGSFFVAEKLTSKDVEKVAQLSEAELKTVMEKELGEAKARITEIVDDNVDLSINKLKREIDKKTQDTLMAIGEYSESVNTELQKANKEATFLYSMLCDRHDEINEANNKLNESLAEYKEASLKPVIKTVEKKVEETDEKAVETSAAVGDNPVLQKASAVTKPVINMPSKEALSKEDSAKIDKLNVKDSDEIKAEVLRRFKEGQAIVDIARELKMGQGEISLIVRLYNEEGEKADET